MFLRVLFKGLQWLSDDFTVRAPRANYKPLPRDKFPHDRYRRVRGQWQDRLDFLLTVVGVCIGLGNIWRFPMKVYDNGRGTFLIIYFGLTMLYSFPMVVFEMGIGQFTSASCVRCFNCVPLFRGVAITILFLSCIIIIFYGVIMTYCYYYMFASIALFQPWNHCNNYFNTFQCISSYMADSNVNRSDNNVYSTEEYWEYFVVSIRDYPSDQLIDFLNATIVPRWQLALCLMFNWALLTMVMSFDLNTSGKFLYFTVIFPYISFICLIFKFSNLPGAREGISYYLTPDWNYFLSPQSYYLAMGHLTFSFAFAQGPIIALSSYNDFHDNFLKDALILVIVDSITSFLAGYVAFAVIGYIQFKTGRQFNEMFTSGPQLFFVAFTASIAKEAFPIAWTVLFMITSIIMGIETQLGMIESFFCGICDLYPDFLNFKHRRLITACVVNALSCIIGLFAISPFGHYWYYIIENDYTSSYSTLNIALLEIVIFCYIYGYNNLIEDFYMMLGLKMIKVPIYVVTFIIPVLIVVFLVLEIVYGHNTAGLFNKLPRVAKLFLIIMYSIFLAPIIFFMIKTLYEIHKKNPEISNTDKLKLAISPTLDYGPYYHIHWVLGERYCRLLLEHGNDQEFLDTFKENENYLELINFLNEGKDAKDEKLHKNEDDDLDVVLEI